METQDYYVVFEHTGKDSIKGIKSYSHFKDKKDFEEWYDKNPKQKEYEIIVKQGLTKNEAQKLCTKKSPLAEIDFISKVAKDFTKSLHKNELEIKLLKKS